MHRLFSWEHSYFSGKVRAYLRHKHRQGALGDGFEDVLATPELIQGLLIPRSGSGAVPQLEAADGSWIQDSSEIIDWCEAAHPQAAVIPDAVEAPVQCLVSHLVELLADEWMVVPGFWERWYFSEDGRSPSHRGFNEQQWGAVLAAGAPGEQRRRAGAAFFETAFGISHARTDPRGVYAGLVHLGVDEKTEPAWQASQHRLLGLLEAHFARHDYVLGGRPSLGDYGLLAPLYAHLYRDAVAGFALRTHIPIVSASTDVPALEAGSSATALHRQSRGHGGHPERGVRGPAPSADKEGAGHGAHRRRGDPPPAAGDPRDDRHERHGHQQYTITTYVGPIRTGTGTGADEPGRAMGLHPEVGTKVIL